jgi:hypothetical protein
MEIPGHASDGVAVEITTPVSNWSGTSGRRRRTRWRGGEDGDDIGLEPARARSWRSRTWAADPHFTAAAAFALVRTRQRQLPMEAKGAEQGTIYLRQATRREQQPRPKPWGESRSPRWGFRTEYDGHDRGGGDI